MKFFTSPVTHNMMVIFGAFVVAGVISMCKENNSKKYVCENCTTIVTHDTTITPYPANLKFFNDGADADTFIVTTITNYKDNIKHGAHYVLKRNFLRYVANYDNGKLSGIEKDFDEDRYLGSVYYHKNDTTLDTYTHDWSKENIGVVRRTGQYLNGKKSGDWVYWGVYYDDGELKKRGHQEIITYKDGVMIDVLYVKTGKWE